MGGVGPLKVVGPAEYLVPQLPAWRGACKGPMTVPAPVPAPVPREAAFGEADWSPAGCSCAGAAGLCAAGLCAPPPDADLLPSGLDSRLRDQVAGEGAVLESLGDDDPSPEHLLPLEKGVVVNIAGLPPNGARSALFELLERCKVRVAPPH